MNIVYFCPSEGMYGDNMALLRIMPHLMKHGVKPLFIVAYEGDFSKKLQEEGYSYIISNNRLWNLYDLSSPIKNFIIGCIWRIKKHYFNKRSVTIIARKIEDFHANLVHSNSSNSSFGFYLAKAIGVKHVWHLREYAKLDANKQYFPSKSIFLKRLRSESNYTISITPLISSYFQRMEKDKVIYDGVIDNSIAPMSIKEKEKQFLFVGRLFEKKGIKDVITAFAKASNCNEDYCLCIVGDGNTEYKEYLVELTKELDISQRVIFMGYRKDVTEIMNKSKALIVASDFEAFGFITAEAMNAGCYVIGKNTAGTKLQMDNVRDVLGKECSSRFMSVEQLVKIMINVMNGSIQTDAILLDIQHTVRNLYSTEKSAKEVYEYYKEILN